MTVQAANWMAGIVLPMLLAAGCAIDGLASSRSLAAMHREVDLWLETAEGEVRERAVVRSGEGVPFGYRAAYGLSDGSVVECSGRFGRFRCAGGWRLSPQTL